MAGCERNLKGCTIPEQDLQLPPGTVVTFECEWPCGAITLPASHVRDEAGRGLSVVTMEGERGMRFFMCPASQNFPGVRRPIAATIAAVIRNRSVLLVRRANPPDVGRWGFPGGKIDFGETLEQAAVRELFEETGVVAEAGSVFTAVDAFDGEPGAGAHAHYVLIAVLCRWLSGEPAAGDDALEAAWHDLDGLEDAGLAMSFGVARVARQAAALAASADGG